MTDHIIDITYYPNVHQYTARAVYQYDKGWQLKISGLTTKKVVQVQYGIEGLTQTLNIDPEYNENSYVAKIPDVLLTQTKNIIAYVYIADAFLGQTVGYIRIPITPREKPADYTYTQEEVAGYAQLMAQLTQAKQDVEELDKTLETVIAAADAATTSAAQASQAANEASQAASNVVTEFENIKQNVNLQISDFEERITELEENPPSALPEDWTPTIDNIEGLSDALSNIVEVSSEEPKDKNTELWVNPDSEELQIPQIDDKNVSAYDTYSSQKIEETVTDLRNDINALANTMALLHAGVPDTSAKAASHELYATDAPMHVTLYGATTQAGSGDPSPDNVRPIIGMDVATVMAGGRNVLCLGDLRSPSHAQYCAIQEDGTILLNKTNSSDPLMSIYLKHPVTIGNGMKFVVEKNTISLINVTIYTKESGMIQDRKINNDGLYSYNLSAYEGQTIDRVGVYLHSVAQYENATIRYMLRYDDKTEYEPFNASVIDMTNALNGEALYGDGTVDDTIENDVPSGCDGKLTLTGDENWKRASSGWFYCDFPETNVITNTSAEVTNIAMYSNWMRHHNPTIGNFNTFNWMYSSGSNRLGCCVDVANVDEFKQILAANPLTVYYRSTEYTPDKDIRVTKVMRKYQTMTLDGVNCKATSVSTFGVNKRFGINFKGAPKYVPTVAPLCDKILVDAAFTIGATNATADALYIHSTAILFTSAANGTAITTIAECNEWLAENKPVFVYELNAPEIYYTDPVELRKPAGLMPVTVTGSGETAVEYVHDTKHYIDSQIAAVVALAMNG